MSKNKLENCPRLRIDIPPTAFRTETLILILIPTLTSDFDLQARGCYGHTRAKGQGQRSIGSKVRMETDERTDGGDCITLRSNDRYIPSGESKCNICWCGPLQLVHRPSVSISTTIDHRDLQQDVCVQARNQKDVMRPDDIQREDVPAQQKTEPRRLETCEEEFRERLLAYIHTRVDSQQQPKKFHR